MSDTDDRSDSYEDEQLTSDDTLISDGVADPLDRGYSPPDRAPHGYGTGHDGHETIADRIGEEVPDPTSAYGAPRNESGLDAEPVGGDDPDAIAAEDDWLGDGEVGDDRAGRLVADDEGAREDDDSDAWGRDVGVDGAGASAEEAAMHVITETD